MPKPGRLNLVQQGILAIALPLVFQVVSILVLTHYIQVAQKELIQESRSREIIATLEHLRHEGAVAANLAFFYKTSPDAEILKRHDQAIASIIDSFKHLRSLLQGHNETQLKNMQRLIANGIMLDRLYLRSPVGNKALEMVGGGFSGESLAFGTAKGPFSKVLAHETNNIAIYKEQRSRFRESIVQVLAAGLALNVAVSLVIAYALRRSLATRLRKVMENAQGLVDGARMSPPIPAGDEVGELDQALCRTADELKEMEDFRRQLVSMVSHELKAPLTSVRLNLEVWEMVESVSPSQMELVQRGRSEVDFLIALVNNLLLVENVEAGNLKLNFADVSLVALLDSVKSQYEQQAHKCNLLVRVNNDFSLSGDKHYLAVALLNLLQQLSAVADSSSSIAIDAGSGKSITLSLEPVQNVSAIKEQDPALRWACAEAILKLHNAAPGFVNDNAIGISFSSSGTVRQTDRRLGTMMRTAIPALGERTSSLWRVGSILVAVPLTFAIIFTISFTAVLMQAEEQLAMSFRAKEVIAHASSLSTSLGRSVTAALAESAGSPVDQTSRHFVDAIQAEIEGLKSLLSADPQSLSLIEPVERKTTEMSSILSELSKMPGTLTLTEWIGGKFDVKMLATGVLQLTEGIDRLIEHEQKQQADADSRTSLSGRRISALLTGGCVTSLLLSIGLSIFLSTALASRMRKLIENVHRLRDREALLVTVPGTDEVAQLDQILHLAYDARREFEKFKSDLVLLVRGQISEPLARLHGALEMLEADAPNFMMVEREKLEQLLKTAIASTKRIQALVDDLLNVQVFDAAKFDLEEVSVLDSDLIGSAVINVQELAAIRDIELRQMPSAVTFECDRQRILQVLINLLSNAIKFSSAGQTISIESHRVDRYVEFRVIDQGRGVPPEFMDKLFQSYSQVESDDVTERGGTGLGLYISRQIVEQHGGEIGANSILNQGSTFWLKLPVAKQTKN